MGNLFSKKSTPDSFEKVLSDLENKIRKAELHLSEIKIRERRAKVRALWYGLSIYGLFWLAIFSYSKPHPEKRWEAVYKVTPLIGGPVGLYYVMRFINYFYKRNRQNIVEEIENLKAKKLMKIEELKERTAYYLTKGLLERYEKELDETQDDLTSPQNSEPSQRLGGANRQSTPNSDSLLASPTSDIVNNPSLSMVPYSEQGMYSDNGQMQGFVQEPANARSWMDKLVDKLVGDDATEVNNKYALVCSQCFRHNGLARAEEFDEIQYFCFNCNFFNPSRKSLSNSARSTLQLSDSPEQPATVRLPSSSTSSTDTTLQNTSTPSPSIADLENFSQTENSATSTGIQEHLVTATIRRRITSPGKTSRGSKKRCEPELPSVLTESSAEPPVFQESLLLMSETQSSQPESPLISDDADSSAQSSSAPDCSPLELKVCQNTIETIHAERELKSRSSLFASTPMGDSVTETCNLENNEISDSAPDHHLESSNDQVKENSMVSGR